MLTGGCTSVLIPSHGRPGKLEACLGSLARQSRPPLEVRVVLDGGSPAEANALRRAWKGPLGGRLQVAASPRLGYLPARVRLLAEARGEIALSLNDDVTACEHLVEAHERAHARHDSPVLATGPAEQNVSPSPADPRPATLFDRLVAETPLVFFDASAAAAAGRLTYRHVYGLNLSAPTGLLQRVGGFHNLAHTYGYDDLELAWRATHRGGAALAFESEAAVVHHHRVTPRSLLRRERALGMAASRYARANPAFGLDLFGVDLCAAKPRAELAAALRRDARDARRNRRDFLALAQLPAATVPNASPLLEPLSRFWVPAKRWLWRRGVLESRVFP